MQDDQTSRDDTPPSGSGSAERRLIDAARAAVQEGSSGHEAPVHSPLPVDRFRGYQVIREIHRGGQGVVYQGIQLSTGRKIAIKVMHAGPFATATDRKRFEREVEILAQLSHPNIVDVLDSGEADGSFFYVMEYISGRTLDRYIEQNELSQNDVIELAAKICDAVNAAHLRGVIHRDLKPANIRVDSSGEPHIVDFGLAKVVGGSSGTGPGEAMMTMTGQFIGSLPWASPEQAEGAPDKIDVRTDVYSLGVVIFQLLTGAFPYEVVGNMRDVLDNILKAEPRRPSTVGRKINNEIETIVLKCLSKERDRRYQNAGEIGRDLHRYLRGEPIEAKRDSNWYVLTKMAKRHRVPVIAGGLMLVMLVVFAVLMSVLWGEAQRARGLAETEQSRAEAAQQVAVLEARKATSVQNILQRILTKRDSEGGTRPGLTVVELLDETRADLDRDLAEDPMVEAVVRFTLGQSYFALGKWPMGMEQQRAALRLWSRELGETSDEAMDAMHELALTLRNLNEYDEATTFYRRYIRAREQRYGMKDHRRLIAMVNLARVLDSIGKLEQADPLLRDAIEGLKATDGPGSSTTLSAMNHLGTVLRKLERLEEAEVVLRDSLRALEALHPPPHQRPALARRELALLLGDLGRHDEAEAELRKSVRELEAAYEDDTNPNLVGTLISLAKELRDRGKYEEADPVFRRAIKATADRFGSDNPRTELYRASLGISLMRQGRFDEAEPVLRQSVDLLVRTVGRENPTVRDTVEKLVELYELMDRPDDADRYRAILNPARRDGP